MPGAIVCDVSGRVVTCGVSSGITGRGITGGARRGGTGNEGADDGEVNDCTADDGAADDCSADDCTADVSHDSLNTWGRPSNTRASNRSRAWIT